MYVRTSSIPILSRGSADDVGHDAGGRAWAWGLGAVKAAEGEHRSWYEAKKDPGG